MYLHEPIYTRINEWMNKQGPHDPSLPFIFNHFYVSKQDIGDGENQKGPNKGHAEVVQVLKIRKRKEQKLWGRTNIVFLDFEIINLRIISMFEVKNRADTDGMRADVLQSYRGINKININDQNKKYWQKSN